MAMNGTFGVGFSFGAEDAGLLKLAKQSSLGFDDMTRSADQFSSSTSLTAKDVEQSLDSIADSFSTTELQAKLYDSALASTKVVTSAMTKATQLLGKGLMGMGGVLAKMRLPQRFKDIAGSLKQTTLGLNGMMELTTGYESEMIQLGKTARATGANMGYSGEALSKFSSKATGMAKGLNIDAKSAGEAIYAFDIAGKQLKALGLDSAEDVAKFNEAFGLGTEVLRDNVKRLQTEIGLSDEQLKGMVSSVVEYGKIAGDVSGSMKGMDKLTDILVSREAMGATTADLEAFAKQTMGLSAGFYSLTQNSEQAQDMAVQFATKMTDARVETQKLMFGKQKELSEFLTNVGVGTGDIGVAFDSLNQGPMEFMTTIDKMVRQTGGWEKVSQTDLDNLRLSLGAALGDDKLANTFVETMRTSGTGVEDLMKQVSTASNDLGALAKEGFTTGYSLQDKWQMAQDRFYTSFRKIGKQAAKDFVKNASAEFGKFDKKLKGLVEKGGPMADFVTKMSEMASLGPLALLPANLQPVVGSLSAVAEQMGPIKSGLESLGFEMQDLVSPMGLATAGVAAIGVRFTSLLMEGKSTEDALSIIFTEDIPRVFSQAAELIKSAWKALFPVLKRVSLKFFTELLPSVAAKIKALPWEEFAGKLWHYLDIALTKVVDIGEVVFGAVSSIDWKEVSNLLGKGISFVMSKVEPALKVVSETLLGFLGKIFDTIPTLLRDIVVDAVIPTILNVLKNFPFRTIVDFALRATRLAIKAVADLFATTDWVGIFDEFVQTFKGVSNQIVSAFADVDWAGIFDDVFKVVDTAFGVVANPKVAEWIGTLAENFAGMAGVLGEAFFTLIGKALDYIGSKDFDDKLMGVFRNVINGLGNAFEKLLPVIQSFLSKIPGLLSQAAQVVVKFVMNLPDKIAELGDLISSKVKEFAPKIVPMLLEFGWKFLKFISYELPARISAAVPKLFAGLVKLVWKGITWATDALFSVIQGAIDWVKTKVPWLGNAFQAVFNVIKEVWAGVKYVIDNFIDSISQIGAKLSEALTWVIDNIGTVASDIWEGLKGAAAGVLDWFKGLPGQLLELLVSGGELASELANAGMAFVTNMLDGMLGEGVTQKISDTMMEFLNSLISWLPFSEPANAQSPLSNLAESGLAFVSNFLSGLLSGDAISAIASSVGGFCLELANSLLEGVGSVVEGAYDMVTGVFSSSEKGVSLGELSSFSGINQMITDAAKAQKALDSVMPKQAGAVEDALPMLSPESKELVDTFVVDLGGSIYTTVFEGVTSSFSDSFMQVQMLTGQFAALEVGYFSTMTKSIKTIMTDAWSSILEQVDMSVTAIQTDMSAISGDLLRLSEARASMYQAQIEAAPATIAAEVAAPPLDAAWEDQLLYATHQPTWYTKQYQPLFKQLLSKIDALLAVQGATPGTTLKKAGPTASGSVRGKLDNGTKGTGTGT